MRKLTNSHVKQKIKTAASAQSQVFKSSEYKTLIFDLGNVLISFNHKKMVQQLADLCNLPFSTLKQFIFEKKIGQQYEKGLISSQELHGLLCKLAHKKLNFSSLMKAAADIFTLRKEMIALLHRLKKNGYRLLLLSNTSEAHITFLQKQYSFLKLFDGMTLSYVIKALKPEKAMYEHCLSLAKCSPSHCFYTDDLIINIRAGETLGIKGHLFQSYPALMQTLRSLGILST